MLEAFAADLGDRLGLRVYAHEAAFSAVETLPTESDRFWSYRLHA
ncbi:MAG: hypothetical protein WEB13_01175 [Dehalococcoidia bacterium]